ncbi:MAG: MotA/TolQ/ExbB proton channel family protein [Pseudomonadota bacterium]
MVEIAGWLNQGGPVLWVIFALSILALTLIIWKIAHLTRLGAFDGGSRTEDAILGWCAGQHEQAIGTLRTTPSLRGKLAYAAMEAAGDAALTAADAREETTRVARNLLARARAGLRPLDMISTVAPLLGLLGTVLGMIEAFQALEDAGSRPDPTALAGGIWQALLTTAAGMAVAIPAAMALIWFDGIAERLQRDMEDAATRIFLLRAS